MQLGELFDLSMRVYRVLGWRILAASAVPTVFSLAGFAFLLQYVMPGFASTTQGTSQQGQVAEAAINMLLGIFVAGPLILIGISMATTYIAPLVSNFMHGLPPDYKAADEEKIGVEDEDVILAREFQDEIEMGYAHCQCERQYPLVGARCE